MLSLTKRNIQIYFNNISGVLMSSMGALIGFFIYICFLQNYLEKQLPNIANKGEVLDLWMLAGLIAIAGITTSFQALGQFVRDRETNTAADFELTDVSIISRNMSYIFSATLISFMMQLLLLLIVGIYFKVVDGVSIPNNFYLPASGLMLLSAFAATLVNQLFALLIKSSATYSHLASIMSAAAGFIVATYMPYGVLATKMKFLVKLFPSSYEAASLRSFLLNDLKGCNISKPVKSKMISDLAIHFKINGNQLSNVMNVIVILSMIALLIVVVSILAIIINKRKE